MVGRPDISGDREVSKFIKPTIGIQWYRKVTGGQRGNTQGRLHIMQVAGRSELEYRYYNYSITVIIRILQTIPQPPHPLLSVCGMAYIRPEPKIPFIISNIFFYLITNFLH